MSILDPIDTAYPKVKPLALALIHAAAEQGATAEEFHMAYSIVKTGLEKKASAILVAELQGDASPAFHASKKSEGGESA